MPWFAWAAIFVVVVAATFWAIIASVRRHPRSKGIYKANQIYSRGWKV